MSNNTLITRGTICNIVNRPASYVVLALDYHNIDEEARVVLDQYGIIFTLHEADLVYSPLNGDKTVKMFGTTVDIIESLSITFRTVMEKLDTTLVKKD